MKTKEKEPVKIIEDLVEKLFDFIGLKVDFEVKKEDVFYLVNLNAGEDTGLIIGRKGENISALKNFLQISLKQKLGDWYYVKVNVGDWLERQEEYLKSLAEKACKKAKETGTPQYLYNLSSDQRRLIHTFVSVAEGVKSESTGEGKDRCLVISPDDNNKKVNLEKSIN